MAARSMFSSKVPDVSTLLQSNGTNTDDRSRGMALDIGGKLFEAMKHSNKTALDFIDFKTVVEQWYHDHGKTFDSTQDAGLTDVFNQIDKDGDKKITKDEIFQFLFHYLDTNGDGVW